MLWCVGRAVNNVIALAKLVEQLLQFLRWVLKVVVHGDSDVTARSPNAAKHGVVLPIVAAHSETTNATIRSHERLDYVPGFVPTTVLDEQDLELDLELFQRLGEACIQVA
jgi:hypothetical protein